ncbi:MAG: energy transducer TonB [Bacteroidales bacterium]|nr:energy transducer TonB [Bacteroidales bacterium]
METKKSDRVNLEKKRSMFFQVGLLLALGVTFVAFEWQVAPRLSDVAWDSPTPPVDDAVYMIRTFSEPPPPQVSLDLTIVDYTIDVGDMPHIIFDAESGGENILPTGVFAQTEIVIEVEPEVFNPALVEVQPLFNGKPAEEAFRDYISQNLKYPQIAIDHGISGKVFVQFVVDTNGNTVDVQVVRSADASLDNEALRLIRKTSGMWTPGKQRNEPVKVRYTFPITFRLQ